MNTGAIVNDLMTLPGARVDGDGACSASEPIGFDPMATAGKFIGPRDEYRSTINYRLSHQEEGEGASEARGAVAGTDVLAKMTHERSGSINHWRSRHLYVSLVAPVAMEALSRRPWGRGCLRDVRAGSVAALAARSRGEAHHGRWGRRSIAILVLALATIAVLATVAREPIMRTFGWHIDATTTTASLPRLPEQPPDTVSQLAWQLPAEHPTDLHVSVDGAYLAAADDHGIRVYDAVTGRERWRYLDDFGIVRNHVVFVGSGRAAIRLADRDVDPNSAATELLVFDLTSGRRLASLDMPKDAAATRYLLLPNLTIRAPNAEFVYSPVLEPSPREVHLLEDPVQALRDDGSVAWEWRAACSGGMSVANAVVTVAGGRVIVATECNRVPDLEPRGVNLVALDPGTGREAWRTHLNDATLAGSPLLDTPSWGDDPLLLIGGDPLRPFEMGRDTVVIAVDPATGQRIGARPLGITPWRGVDLSPIPDGWCAASNGAARCVDAATGHERWSYRFGDEFSTDGDEAFILPSADRVVVAACDNDPATTPTCDAVVLDMKTGATVSPLTTLHGARVEGDDDHIGSLEPIYFGPTGLLLEHEVVTSEEFRSTITAYR